MHIVEGPAAADLLSLQAAEPARFPCLLESAAAHPRSGRFDLLMMVDTAADAVDTVYDADPFALLDARLAALPRCAPHPVLPFAGGYAVFLGYEAGRWVEPRWRPHAQASGLPEAQLLRVPAALMRDRADGRVYALSERSQAEARSLLDALAAAPSVAPAPQTVLATMTAEPPAAFLAGVARIHEWLCAGDVFQVNLSRAWSGALAEGVAPAHLHRALRAANPAPFAASWRGQGWSVVSSSPERLVSIRGDQVDTRPIAGTAPRGRDAAADAQAIAGLRASAKERAEHIMLIDLERNDLGRVCQPGSVRVDELMTVETYPHVHHLVSNVSGRLRPGVGAGAALRAVFPGGTITGCPKVRCMEIISELESGQRGAYTGAIGYASRCGQFDSNILIRSLSVVGRHLSLRAGAGIVADSNAITELAETEAKARGLLRALGFSG